jgi:hypothetical protein
MPTPMNNGLWETYCLLPNHLYVFLKCPQKYTNSSFSKIFSVQQAFVLHPSYVPEKLGVNQKWYSCKK